MILKMFCMSYPNPLAQENHATNKKRKKKLKDEQKEEAPGRRKKFTHAYAHRVQETARISPLRSPLPRTILPSG
jgi:hypothetical protein